MAKKASKKKAIEKKPEPENVLLDYLGDAPYNGDGLKVEKGATSVEVSREKARQLDRDFPKQWKKSPANKMMAAEEAETK